MTPKFQELSEALERETIRIQDSASGASPEYVIVFETVGLIQDLLKAAARIPELEALVDWAADDITPDADFFSVDKDGQRKEDLLSGRLYAVSTNRRALDQLLSLWKRYCDDPTVKFETGLAPFKNLFKFLKDVRRWDVQDRLGETGVLQEWRQSLQLGAQTIRFEAELWCRDTADKRTNAFAAFSAIIEQEGGRCLSQVAIPDISYHGVLVEAQSDIIVSVLERGDANFIRSQDVMLFRSVGQAFSKLSLDFSDFRAGDDSSPPAEGNPVIAVFDGLPVENHSVLRNRIIVDDPLAWARDYPAAERIHGTAMASAIVRGDLTRAELSLKRPIYIRPIMRPFEAWPFSPRPERCPDDVLLIDLVHSAVRRLFEPTANAPAVAPTVKVVNLSIGDPAFVFTRFLSPLARLLDWLSFKYRVVFVVSAGNYTRDIELSISSDTAERLGSLEKSEALIAALHEDQRLRSMLSPAESVNALTIGAVNLDGSTFELPQTHFAIPDGLPATYSRVGPGYRNSVKPDILMPGGRHLLIQQPSSDAAIFSHYDSPSAPGILVAAPSPRTQLDNGVAYSRGTSNSTALATRCGAQILEMLDQLTNEPGGEQIIESFHSVIVKCLLAHGASWDGMDDFFRKLFRQKWKDRNFEQRLRRELGRYLGYGLATTERVLGCEETRCTVLGCGELNEGEAAVFRLPLPSTLNSRTDWRRLTATLAYFTPLNSQHRAYRKAHLWIEFSKDVLGVKGRDAWHQVTERGTLQHVVADGELAVPFADEGFLEIKVNCREDAPMLTEAVPYALAVTIETAPGSGVHVYSEIRDRIRPRLPIENNV